MGCADGVGSTWRRLEPVADAGAVPLVVELAVARLGDDPVVLQRRAEAVADLGRVPGVADHDEAVVVGVSPGREAAVGGAQGRDSEQGEQDREEEVH